MKLSLHDKTLLYHELAKLTASGFGFDKSAELLLEQAPNRATAAFAGELIERLRRGESIAAAMHQPARNVHGLDTSVVRVAELGGVLETGFAYLRDHYTALRRTRQAVTAKLLYPAILLHLAVFLPVLPRALLGLPVTGPLLESLLLLATVYLASAALAGIWHLLHHWGTTSPLADRCLAFLPLFGKARRLAALQRFAAVFRIGLRAALRPSEALKAAGEAAGSAALTHTALALARHAELGQSLSSLLPQSRNLPPDFRRSLATAEVSGTLEQDLHAWTQSFAHELETHRIRMATLLPMGATLLVAGFVGWRLATLYSGILASEGKFLESLW